MSKLFISYPSESWNFAQRIAEKLAERLDNAIFIDYRSIDQADFADAILTHLRASDAVLLVVTEFTFADIHRDRDWVRLEIRTALENDIPIVLVRENGLLPPPDLPEDVQRVGRSQGVPFYREFFDPGIVLLADFLVTIGVGVPRRAGGAPNLVETAPPAPERPAAPEPPQRAIAGPSSLDEAADLLEAGDHEKALVILETLRAAGTLRAVYAGMLNDLLAEAERQAAEAARRRDAALDYEAIVLMARRKLTVGRARDEFAAWRARYPDLWQAFDHAGLNDRLAPPATPLPAQRSAERSAVRLLPAPFAWVEIPAGRGTMATSTSGVTLVIPSERYWMAKYPVTNAQYATFIEAVGYNERQWWTDAGWEQRQKNKWTEPRYWTNSKFNGAEQPVVGVSWYEAVAFCRWLSDVTSEQILLPTEAQWQYAAQGDDERDYPWGNQWDAWRCNNNVDQKGIGKTTLVRQYEGKGDSPFGVVDMGGNLWEWCLTAYESGSSDLDGTGVRVLRGGSWNLDRDAARALSRLNGRPGIRDYTFGIRLCLRV